MPKLGHTPHTMEHIIEPIVASFVTNIMFQANYMCNFSWPCHTRLSCCFKQNTIHIHPFGHICRRVFPSHLTWTTKPYAQPNCTLGCPPNQNFIYLQICHDMCIFIYVQGAITFWFNFQITGILVTHPIMQYILITPQHDT
jgi:hypothetical protein